MGYEFPWYKLLEILQRIVCAKWDMLNYHGYLVHVQNGMVNVVVKGNKGKIWGR